MKKRLLCLFCAALLISALPVSVSAETGSVPIATRADLLLIGENPSASYVLVNDIDMGKEEWTPIPFSGTLDGGGHTLYNLTVSSTGSETEITYDGNRREYETEFAGLFSVVKNAHIFDLNLVNAKITVRTEKDCFIAALAGYAANSLFERCTVETRVSLTLSGTNEGVGGLIGFCDECEFRNCAADSVLTFTDVNPETDCEEFLGGIYASGSGRIFDSSVKTRGFAEIYGYAHNGGMVGMHKLRRGSSFKPRIVRSTSDCELSFFEVAPSKRCYRDALVGEDAAKDCYLTGNTVLHFEADYTRTERRVRPEPCDNPEYEKKVIEPTCSSWGYTVFTCKECGYTFKDLYTEPAHRYEAEIKPATCTEDGETVYTCVFCGDSYTEILPAEGHHAGEWTIVQEAKIGTEGKEILSCTECGTILEERIIPALPEPEVTVSGNTETAEKPKKISVRLSEESVTMKSGMTEKLDVQTDPAETEVRWTSSDPDIVRVSDDGTLTAGTAGSALITCEETGGTASASCSVKVTYTFGQIFVRYVLFGWLWDK